MEPLYRVIFDRIMILLALVVLMTPVRTQITLDPGMVNIFTSTPPGDTSPSEPITVMPTDSTPPPCQCVPYFYCDSNNVSIHLRNASVSGIGNLDFRFGGDSNCNSSVDTCCTAPRSELPQLPQPQPPQGCGYRNPAGVGGTYIGNVTDAQFGEFPWVIALIDANNDSFIGAGVLIHPQVVLTGAHVVYKYPQETLRARAGEWDTQTINEILPFQEQDVVEMYIHKDFNNFGLMNDVALLRLRQPFQLAEHINVICLPQQDELFEDSTNCIANGWGKDIFDVQGRYAVILKKVELDIVPFSRCRIQMKNTEYGDRLELHNSFICAAGENGEDTCEGDGGGPLACPLGGDRYKLAGLVSWGVGCGRKDVPGVYANVPLFRRWLDAKIAEWGFDLAGSTP